MKIDRKFILFAAFSVSVQLLILFASSYYIYKQHITKEVTYLISQETEKLSFLIRDKIASLESDIDILSRNDILNKYISSKGTIVGDYIIYRSMLNELDVFLNSIESLKYVSVHNGEFEKILSSKKSNINNISDEELLYLFEEYIQKNKHKGDYKGTIILNGTPMMLVVSKLEKYQNTSKNIGGYVMTLHSLDFINKFMEMTHLGRGGWNAIYNDDVLLYRNIGFVEMSLPLRKDEFLDIEKDSLTETIYIHDLLYVIGWHSEVLLVVFEKILYLTILVILITVATINFMLIYHMSKYVINPLQLVISKAKRSDNRFIDLSIPENMNKDVKDLLTLILEKNRELDFQRRKIKEIAYIDTLTKLHNRAFFEKKLNHSIEQKKENSVFCLLFLDLDDFKMFNDSLGHDFGDEVLKLSANKIKKALTSSNVFLDLDDYLFSRFGGDEFAIFLSSRKEEIRFLDLASEIIEEFKCNEMINEQSICISISIGIATSRDDIKDYKDFIKKADIAMYDAKNDGRNTFKVYNVNTKIKIQDNFILHELLRNALNRNELYVHYQPQVCSRTDKIIGVEALMRWENEEYGKIPNNTFIPIAEETEEILDIGRWLVIKIFEDIKLMENFIDKDFTVSINISSIQLRKDSIVELILDKIKESNISPTTIKIEITEGTLFSGENAIKQIKLLNDSNVHISLDDFGTGFSSLSMVKDIPISELKIDRSFLKDILNDPKSQAVVKTIVSFAKNLNLSVIAEGVESKQQLIYLQKIGVNTIQGFYYYKPMDINSIISLLRKDFKH